MSPRDSHVVETEGDIFNMPPKSILVREWSTCCAFGYSFPLTIRCHVDACNCQGVWGAGIAKAVKEKVCSTDSRLLSAMHLGL